MSYPGTQGIQMYSINFQNISSHTYITVSFFFNYEVDDDKFKKSLSSHKTSFSLPWKSENNFNFYSER